MPYFRHIQSTVNFAHAMKIIEDAQLLDACEPMETFQPHTVRVGPVNIQTSASDVWGKQIHPAWDRIPRKYLKRANI
jgi:hypothetical protein